MPSDSLTPWAVHCQGIDPLCGVGPCTNGPVYLTEEEYDCQMNSPDSLWRCPRCGGDACWDDDIYEAAMDAAANLAEERER